MSRLVFWEEAKMLLLLWADIMRLIEERDRLAARVRELEASGPV